MISCHQVSDNLERLIHRMADLRQMGTLKRESILSFKFLPHLQKETTPVEFASLVYESLFKRVISKEENSLP